jgi:uncharacterized protein
VDDLRLGGRRRRRRRAGGRGGRGGPRRALRRLRRGPDGRGLWQPGRHRGAQIVNEPGSWNWSDLISTDATGAEAFYGAVFGWRADQIDMGEGPYTLWRVPGYRAIHGAPEGFEDVVAGMRAAPPGQAARWAVSFVVDDADAAAARARELGGSVVVEPFEVTFSRLAVVADPAGATFTVSTLRSA